MTVIPGHDPGQKNRRPSCALLSLGAMGTYPCAALMEPVVDPVCIVIARAVRQGRPCPTGPSSIIIFRECLVFTTLLTCLTPYISMM